MKFYLNKELYPKLSIIKAAYQFTDRAYIYLSINNDNYIMDFTLKNPDDQILEKEILNELLMQSLKIQINQETKHIRNLIAARAMASTLIETEKTSTMFSEVSQEESYDENEVLSDWYKNENN